MLSAAVAVPLLIAPAGEAGSSERCRVPESRTVIATGQGRIFTIRDRLGRRPVTFYLGCLYRVNRAYVLGRDFRGRNFVDTTRHLRIAGPYAGYAVMSRTEETCGLVAEARVKDLRTGRTERQAPGVQAARERITDLELKSNSSVAWIANTCEAGAPGRDEVNALDADGRRRLDTGVNSRTDPTDIGAGSLALSGSTLYWTKGNAPVSARLR